MRRFPWRSTLILVLGAAPLRAQLAPVGAPKGTFRFTVGGEFTAADQRIYGGHEEDYLADFGSRALGSDRFAFLRAVDSVVGATIGQGGYRVNLGAVTAHGQFTVGTGTIGGAIGITRQLTLFANIPFVTLRVKANLAKDSASGDAGFNPAHPTLGNSAGQAAAGTFFADFTAALATLDARIAGGSYNGDPQQLAIAQAIAARGAAIRDGLAGITTGTDASPFLPTTGSTAGLAIAAAIRGLQDTLSNTLGVASSFTEAPVLADGLLGPTDVTQFVNNQAGPVAALPLATSTISRIGDMDVGAVLTVIDRFDRRGHAPGGFRLATLASLTLPTGLRDNPNDLLHVGTGNGRYELRVAGIADLGTGSWGARLTGGYTRKFSALRVRRVAGPGDAYALASRLSNVNYKAGDVLEVGAQPFFRLARNFALSGSVDYWREAAGSATYYRASDVIPGVPASLLAAESARRTFLVGGGVTYVGRAVRECEEGRRCGLPIDASWRFSRVVYATGGRVPEIWTTRMEIRWYQRLWR
ncbi:MAG: hypothetical protein U0133_00085 [Gemmatimonadales bacterium]